MKLTVAVFTLLLVSLIVQGCRHNVSDIKPEDITPIMKEYFQKDDSYRMLAAAALNISATSTWDELRPLIARVYNLPDKALWEDIRKRRIELGELNRGEDDRERREWAAAFELPEDASWIEIREMVKRARLILLR